MYYEAVTIPRHLLSKFPGAIVIASAPANDNNLDVIPLDVSDVWDIARQHAEIFGAAFDASPSRDVRSPDVSRELSRIVMNDPTMLREIVGRGTSFGRGEIERLSLHSLHSHVIEVVRVTKQARDHDQLINAIIHALRPYSAFLRGELGA